MNVKYPQDAASGMANTRRLRFAVVISILLVLSWLLLDVLEENLQRAEEQSAKLVLNQVRSLLVVKGAEVRLTEGGHYGAQQGRNPFAWFKAPPSSYIGVCPGSVPPAGKWCFKPLQTDITGYKKAGQEMRGQVIFRPTQPITVDNRRVNRRTALAWEVGIEFQDSNGNGRLDEDEPQSGLTLEPTEVGQSVPTDN